MTDLPVFNLAGRKALVTGASRGLGRAIAVALAAAGADVALGLRDAGQDEGVAAEIEGMGRKAVGLQMDVMDLKQSYGAVDRAIAALGHLDILVNNVGGGTERRIEDFPEEEFDSTVARNVKSTFFLSQYVGRHMIARRSGSIVNIGSQAGAVALPMEAIYCLSKAAVAHMTRCFAVEWGAHNIRVNCVAPTFIETDGTRPALSKPDFRADVIERIAALHRIGEPKEVSGAVVFLCSDAASMITGQTLLIDGGWTAR
ncbi:MAG: SDR family oxidoreductase [Rhizobiales bacterium]|nr:SDR family oxidoreductase [Hyphomicrobiales bacterium]